MLPHLAIQPPSTTTFSPDIYELALLAMNTATPLKSSALPHLPIGMRLVIASKLALYLGSVRTSALISVAIYLPHQKSIESALCSFHNIAKPSKNKAKKNSPRTNTIHSNPPSSPFITQGLRQLQHPTFTCRIRHHVHTALHRRQTGYIDHHALLSLIQPVLAHRLACREHRREIRLQYFVVSLECHLCGGKAPLEAGGVE